MSAAGAAEKKTRQRLRRVRQVPTFEPDVVFHFFIVSIADFGPEFCQCKRGRKDRRWALGWEGAVSQGLPSRRGPASPSAKKSHDTPSSRGAPKPSSVVRMRDPLSVAVTGSSLSVSSACT